MTWLLVLLHALLHRLIAHALEKGLHDLYPVWVLLLMLALQAGAVIRGDTGYGLLGHAQVLSTCRTQR